MWKRKYSNGFVATESQRNTNQLKLSTPLSRTPRSCDISSKMWQLYGDVDNDNDKIGTAEDHEIVQRKGVIIRINSWIWVKSQTPIY